MHTSEEKPLTLKVIALGLGRTGTLSLSSALDLLGFGPCHHAYRLNPDEIDWNKLVQATKEKRPELINDIFYGYGSALDSTTAMLAEPLYKLYPDAKFILTVRDPTEWAQSVKKTLYTTFLNANELELRVASGVASDRDCILYKHWEETGLKAWFQLYMLEYLRGRVEVDGEGEFMRHNEYIMNLIPAGKLLIYNVSEGWDPLVRFLEVPKPNLPFPSLNDGNNFNRQREIWVEKLTQV